MKAHIHYDPQDKWDWSIYCDESVRPWLCGRSIRGSAWTRFGAERSAKKAWKQWQRAERNYLREKEARITKSLRYDIDL